MRYVFTLGGGIMLSVFLLIFAHVPEAGAACDANSDPLADCMDNVVNGAKATFTSNNDSQKAQSVGEAVRKCAECASEHISDKLKQFGDTSNEP